DVKRPPAGAVFLKRVRGEHHRLDLGAKALPWHEMIDGFERIAPRRQSFQALIGIEKSQLTHRRLRESKSHASDSHRSGKAAIFRGALMIVAVPSFAVELAYVKVLFWRYRFINPEADILSSARRRSRRHREAVQRRHPNQTFCVGYEGAQHAQLNIASTT